jgi:hypothetical protein
MNEPGASDLKRTRDESIDTGQPVARFAASGERIRAGEVYVVAPDGSPNLDRLQEYLFIQPDHLWRASWLPDRPGSVDLVRDDEGGLPYHPARSTAPGLLGVCAYADGEILPGYRKELPTATANVAAQISNWSPPTMAAVSVPTGFIVNIVQPALVYGTLHEHRRVALGLDSDPGA